MPCFWYLGAILPIYTVYYSNRDVAVIISFLTFGRPIILPRASAAKFIVPHDPSFDAITFTEQRDKECGAYEYFGALFLYKVCSLRSRFVDTKLYIH